MNKRTSTATLLHESRKRWPLTRVYYGLAAIDIVTVVAAIVIGHMTMGIVRGFVEDNNFWAERVAALTNLQSLAGRVNAPGNDVFQSRDVAHERRRRDEAFGDFQRALRQFTDGLNDRLPSQYADRVASDVAMIDHDLARMVAVSDVVFSRHGAGDIKGATNAMATMDRVLADMTAEIGSLSRLIQAVQTRTFDDQLAYAARIQDFKNAYIAIVLLMVAFAILYGNRVARAFREADAERQRFLTGLDGINAGFVHFDATGRLASCNPRYKEIFHYAADLIERGVTLEQLLRHEAARGALGEDREDVERAIQARLAHHAAPVDKQFVEHFSDGRWVLCYDGKTSDGGTVGVRLDISHLKETELALRKAMTEAESANKAKSQFLANMSHEIRTPMNGVIGMAELLSRTPLNGHQQKLVDTIRRSGQTLLEIINDILDFSRIEAGRFELERIAFSIGDAIEDNVELMADAAARKGLAFTCRIAEDVPDGIWGDPIRLKQVVANLIGNAIKFTDRGSVHIDVTAAPAPDERVAVTIVVRDTGIGMDDDARSKLFTPFEQADGSITRRYGGTGLGLSISQRIVMKMGGRIEVESVAGQGSSFRFTVVFDRAPADALAIGDALLLRGRRALVVVGDETNRTILCEYLRGWGFAAMGAATLRSVLDKMDHDLSERRPVDLIVLDLDRACPKGERPDRQIAAYPMLAAAKIIGVTASQSPVDPAGSDRAAFSPLISMPVRRSALFNEIARLFAAAGIDEPPAASSSGKNSVAARIGRAPRLLVAEDNPVNQQVTKGLLESLGCSVELASTGREAVAALEHASYDLVFMDCQMPDLDGLQASRLIREKERVAGGTRRLPIIALTAHAFDDDRARCLSAGMDDFASKPVAADVLEAMLLRWVDRDERLAAPEAVVPSRGAASDGSAASDGGAPASGRKTRDDLRARLGTTTLKRVIDIYLKATPSDLSALGKAIAARDAETARKKAHSLKSGSANLGGDGLAAMLRDIEIGAAQARLDDVGPVFTKAEQEFVRFRAELESESAN